MPNNKAYGAGLYDGKIRTADGTLYDIGAVITMTGDSQVDDVEVKGDDELKATFYFNKREEITISANGISFDVLQAITGNTSSSSASGVEVPLGTTSEANPPYVEVQAFTYGKDAVGASVTIKKTWHKVSLGNIKVEQAGEKELNVEITGMAFPTELDVAGATLSPKRIATLQTIY